MRGGPGVSRAISATSGPRRFLAAERMSPSPSTSIPAFFAARSVPFTERSKPVAPVEIRAATDLFRTSSTLPSPSRCASSRCFRSSSRSRRCSMSAWCSSELLVRFIAASNVPSSTSSVVSTLLTCMNDEMSAPRETLSVASEEVFSACSVAPAVPVAPARATPQRTAKTTSAPTLRTPRLIVRRSVPYRIKTHAPFEPFSVRPKLIETCAYCLYIDLRE